MNSLIHLTQNSIDLLDNLRVQDIKNLILNHQSQSFYEMLILLSILSFIVIYSLINLLKLLPKSVQKQPHFDKQINTLSQIKDSVQFSEKATQTIRKILSEKYMIKNNSLTDIELLKAFKKTTLREKSIETISLLNQSLYGKFAINAKDRIKIVEFINELSKD